MRRFNQSVCSVASHICLSVPVWIHQCLILLAMNPEFDDCRPLDHWPGPVMPGLSSVMLSGAMGLHSLLCPFSPKWKIRLKKKPGRGINGTDRPTVGGPSRPPTLQKASPRPLNLIRFASVMRRKRINKFDRWMLLLHLIFNTWHGRSPGRSPFCENNLHL